MEFQDILRSFFYEIILPRITGYGLGLAIAMAIFIPMVFYYLVSDEVKYLLETRRRFRSKPLKKKVGSRKLFPFQTFRR